MNGVSLTAAGGLSFALEAAEPRKTGSGSSPNQESIHPSILHD